MSNTTLTPEQAEKVLNTMIGVDEGNDTIMTDIFTRFAHTFPELNGIVDKVYQKETGRPFRSAEERVSRRRR